MLNTRTHILSVSTTYSHYLPHFKAWDCIPGVNTFCCNDGEDVRHFFEGLLFGFNIFWLSHNGTGTNMLHFFCDSAKFEENMAKSISVGLSYQFPLNFAVSQKKMQARACTINHIEQLIINRGKATFLWKAIPFIIKHFNPGLLFFINNFKWKWTRYILKILYKWTKQYILSVSKLLC